MKFQFAILLMSMMLIASPTVFAMEGKMPLLAIKQQGDTATGSIAELTLEIIPGTGRVFVDTFPLSKIDTQISMRFSKETACDFLDMDCSKYDFIYTIKANSPIVGGPSAGAASTILTISILSDTQIAKDIALTGTIDSGGLIGPVGGLKEKIIAGSSAGLTTVLIPSGETNMTDSNKSIDLVNLTQTYGVKIYEVNDIYEAMEYFTGIDYVVNDSIEISDNYKTVMQSLATELCDRNKELQTLIINISTIEKQTALNMSDHAADFLMSDEYYSAASFCFGSNVKLSNIFLESKNFSDNKYVSLFNSLNEDINEFDDYIDSKKIETITDLESYMVAKERISEARDYINSTQNLSNPYKYAYAAERLISAKSWFQFFGKEGQTLELDSKSLENACIKRISEAEERIQYGSLYLPFSLEGPKDQLKHAYQDYERSDFSLCIFKASLAKAQINIIINTLSIGTDKIPSLIENKLNAAGRVITKADSKGIFPILGYSYFEYANSLKESDSISSLLYAEYSLELSNLDIYFKKKGNTFHLANFIDGELAFLFIGLTFCFAVGFIFGRIKK